MTVCIAAMCIDEDGRSCAVVASDRMVTLGGFMEFEHTIAKMTAPSQVAIAMIAGSTLVGTRLAQEVVDELSGQTVPILEIAQRLSAKYRDTRISSMESSILTPRGLSLQDYYARQASLNGQITMMIDQGLANYNLGVELLLAGVDSNGAHIYSIENPGQPEHQHDVIGYAAIGIGGIHAIQSMVGFRPAPTDGLRDTIFRVFASKRRSQVAPGVGNETDMAIISQSGVYRLTTEMLDTLETIYNDFQNESTQVVSTALNKLDIPSPDHQNNEVQQKDATNDK